ncbi:MAG: PAS domain-containing sensor histidine kinase [Longimicrobiales bacterium]
MIAAAVLPAAHPLLMPVVGVPSHLLWWVHTLPVAMLAYRDGLRGAVAGVLVSGGLVAVGELAFGAGYGVPADAATVWALTTGVTLTNLLMVGFALYARGVTVRYVGLFEAAASGVLRVGRGGRIQAANPAALRILGVEWGALAGRCMDTAPALSALPPVEDLARQSWSGVLQAGDPATPIDVHVSVTAVREQDSPGYQVLLVDRTTEVAQDHEIERQGRLSTLGEALAGTAHELRNPLQVILSYAEIWQGDDRVPQDLRADLHAIRDEGRRMGDMIAELLGFSREGEGGSSFLLHDLVARSVRMQRMTVAGRVTVEETVEWEGSVAGHRGRVEQILANLLSNATHAVAGVSNGRVRVRLSARDGVATVRVHDDGPGVPAELRERIFEPFVTTKPEGEGTGLGLAISRRLAAGMGGRLYLDTDAGEPGACFVLELPLSDAVAVERKSA